MRHVDVEERRARLARRHHLLPTTHSSDVAEIARDIVGIHSSDPASVYLGIAARSGHLSVEHIERAFYDDRVVGRVLGMRRTMFVAPLDLLPVINAACARALAPREGRRLVQIVEEAGIAADGERWLRAAEEATLQALAARGEAFAGDLSTDVPELREQFSFGEGRKWGGRQAVSTRVLFLLAAQGRIARGRPRGSWISSQYRWAPMESLMPGGLPDRPSPEARVELLGRWLRAFGPGTVADMKWWTGWTLGEVRKALAELDTEEVDIGGTTGLVLADDVEPVDSPEPWVALLPGLDSTVMGWAERGWYLGDHKSALFDRNGNAGPTVWRGGRVVGGWAQRKDGEIAVRLLEDVGREGARAVEEQAASLQTWMGTSRVTFRFRTPLERELTA